MDKKRGRKFSLVFNYLLLETNILDVLKSTRFRKLSFFQASTDLHEFEHKGTKNSKSSQFLKLELILILLDKNIG